jgi:hypothetical protein
MVTADGKRVCDKEVWSRTRHLWVGCRKPATNTVESKWNVSGLDYCQCHTPLRYCVQELEFGKWQTIESFHTKREADSFKNCLPFAYRLKTVAVNREP